MIEFRNVHKYFGTLHVLEDISLRIEAGEVVVICGPSGSGKSTQLRWINRLEEINAGQVIVHGRELSVWGRNIAKLRAETGMVFQRFNLYPHLRVIEKIGKAPTRSRWSCWQRSGYRKRLPLTPAAFRRSAAARGDRTGAGDAAEDHLVRRADFGTGSRDDPGSP